MALTAKEDEYFLNSSEALVAAEIGVEVAEDGVAANGGVCYFQDRQIAGV